MPSILTEILIDKYKNDEISLFQFSQELLQIHEEVDSTIKNELLSCNLRTLPDLPIEICRMLLKIAKLQEPKSILDINCGVGKLLAQFDGMAKIKGIDKNSTHVQLAKLIYPELQITHENPITKEFNEQYDLVISHFPYRERIQYYGMNQLALIPYIEKALSLLSPSGTLICTVSSNFLTAGIFNHIRTNTIDNYNLKMIMAFDSPNLSRRLNDCAVLVISNEKQTENILMPTFQNHPEKIIEEYKERKGFSVPVERLKQSNRWDPHFYDPAFTSMINKKLAGKEVKRIEEMGTVLRGVLVRANERKVTGTYRIIGARNIRNGNLVLLEEDYFFEKAPRMEESRILKSGDIVAPLLGNIGSTYMYKETDPPAIASQDLVIIRSTENEYIKTYLDTEHGKKLFRLQVNRKSRGPQNRQLHYRDFCSIQIPILPIDNLNDVSEKAIANATDEELQKLKEELDIIQEKFQRERRRYKDKLHQARRQSDGTEQILPFIAELFQKIDKQNQQTNSRLASIEQDVGTVRTTVDEILNIVKTLQSELKVIKSLHAEENEILKYLHQKIDETVDQINDRDLEAYITQTKDWINPNWEKLDQLSTTFLPSAEFLYKQHETMRNSDPSPFILQYCRALENELLKKIFIAYVKDLKAREVNVEETFAWDLEVNDQGKPRSKNKNTYDFVTTLNHYLNRDETLWFFELGRMLTILKQLTGRTVERSPVLGDFKSFILRYFQENFINHMFFEEIFRVTKEYRNKAAHPNEMTFEYAKEGRESLQHIIKQILNDFKG